jgi:hypothetical protein
VEAGGVGGAALRLRLGRAGRGRRGAGGGELLVVAGGGRACGARACARTGGRASLGGGRSRQARERLRLVRLGRARQQERGAQRLGRSD